MRRILYTFIFASLAVIGFAQSKQDGFVKEYNDKAKKKPLSGVQLLISNANSEVSGINGDFHLIFRTLKPGDPVRVQQIIKAGYEIFNKEQLDVWRISNNGEPFTIVLCKSSKFKELKDQYNTIAYKSYSAQQDKAMKELDDLYKKGILQKAQYEKQMKDLCEYYDKKLDNLDTYIDRFARIDLSEVTRDEKRIVDLVTQGKIQEAINAYNALRLDEKLIKNYQKYQKTEEAIAKLNKAKQEQYANEEALLSSLKNKYDLMMMQGSRAAIDSILSEYETIALQCPNSYRIIQGLVDFAHQENHFEIAEKWGRALIDILPDKPMLKQRYCILLSKAETYLGNEELAELHRDRASEWLDLAMKEDPASAVHGMIYLRHDILNDKLRKEHHLPELLKEAYAFLEELDSIQTMYPTEDMIHAVLTAKFRVYSVLIEAHLRLQNLNAALDCNKLSTNCVSELAKKYSNEKQYSFLVNAYNDAGYLYLFKRDFDLSEQYLLKAKDILNKWLLKDQYKHFAGILSNYSYLGMCYYHKGEIEKSLEIYKEAVDFSADIVAKRPYPLFFTSYAELSNNLGYIYYVKGDDENAEKIYLKAIDIATPFAQKNPHMYLSSLCLPEINLGVLKLKHGKLNEFLELQNKYWDDTESCYNWLGITYANSYAVALDNKGYYQLLQGNTEEALAIWNKIKELVPQYLDINPISLLYNGLKEKQLIE